MNVDYTEGYAAFFTPANFAPPSEAIHNFRGYLYRVILKSVFQLAEDLVEAEANGERGSTLSTIDVLALEDSA